MSTRLARGWLGAIVGDTDLRIGRPGGQSRSQFAWGGAVAARSSSERWCRKWSSTEQVFRLG